MFTNQKLLGVILILLVLGGGIYFSVSKFKKEITDVTATPSPSPSTLEFLFNTPGPTPPPEESNQPSSTNRVISKPTPLPTELPLSRNKRLSQFPGVLKEEILQNKKAIIETAKGVIQIEIFPEAPQAASNFLILASNGFYDGLKFHRVEDWVIQGGDPLGTGSGGPGYTFADEPVKRDYTKGIVAMANAGPNTNGSQFFILKKDSPLPPNYTIFGAVIDGMGVVENIVLGDVMNKVTISNIQ